MNTNFDYNPTPNSQPIFNFNEQIKSIFTEIFAFFGTVNKQGYLLNLSGNILEKTNLNAKLLIGQKFSETVFWQSSEHTSRILDQAIEEAAMGKPVKSLLNFRISSDNKLIIELHLYPSPENAPEIFFCAYDVTEREREVEYHKQRSEQLLYAAESADIGLWSWDLTDNTFYSTPKCNEFFETKAYEPLMYESFVGIVHPEDRERVEEVLQNSQSTGTEFNEQFRVVYSNGNTEWISARGKTFLDAEGEPNKTMGVVRKITEQKIAEEDLSRVYDREKKARDEAEDANRAKDFFLAFVSHELRSPLNAILGWSKILLTKKVDEETQTSALETIERSARAQAQLINDLVDSARITSGKLRLEFHPVNLYEIVKTVFHSQKPSAEGKNINLQFDYTSEEIPVFADAGRLQQVFNNLISNALKFTPEGGMISVRAETQNEFAKVTVNDNGQGISPESLPNIFRQFSQGNESDLRDRGGLGLGLSIVKILVEKHNGKVQADSAGVGKGSSFTVFLPLYKENRANSDDRESETEQSNEKPLRKVKILLVEDDEDSREVLALFLEQCGALVISADSTKAAMRLLETSVNDLPDVIISDLAMPDEDGYSFISRIRKLPQKDGGEISAIALSAFATKENKEKAFELGFQKYNTKPFEPDLLIQEILSLVKK
ncbi:MAG: domain S-box protein [Acidobacteria bacterium]|jgi:PAS domain S-box-containing protein|nr:domain S-box protein [Acidobacteriota bacterium]